MSHRAAADAVLRRNYHGNIDKDEHHRSSDEDDEEALQRARQWDEFKDGNELFVISWGSLSGLFYRTSEGRRKQKKHGLIIIL